MPTHLPLTSWRELASSRGAETPADTHASRTGTEGRGLWCSRGSVSLLSSLGNADGNAGALHKWLSQCGWVMPGEGGHSNLAVERSCIIQISSSLPALHHRPLLFFQLMAPSASPFNRLLERQSSTAEGGWDQTGERDRTKNKEGRWRSGRKDGSMRKQGA